ncbi:MAG: DNA polymerase III subunit delta [Rhodobacterales bacterium]|nr:MAG: DNA polymerase III subunit delta [Rhodobacterales bacterium]
MKLAPRDAPRFFAKPDRACAGVLIFGADPMRVALKRQQLIANLIGPEGEAEMRLTRMSGADLRSDPAMLADAIKAQGFFPGPRVAFVEEATDGLTKLIKPALETWAEGDAMVVLTAGNLTPRSSLRKYFETHGNAYAAGIYDDPPSRAEIETELAKAGLTQVSPEAMTEIVALSTALDPGDFRQTIEKLSLYKLNDPGPLTPADIDACAPASTEAATDDLLHAVAEGRPADLGPLLHRLEAQGTLPVTLCIAATRHFRTLHLAAADPEGPAKGIARARVHFKSRDRMIRQARAWGPARLEAALHMLIDTDLNLRSSAPTPNTALMERVLIRLAYMPRG